MKNKPFIDIYCCYEIDEEETMQPNNKKNPKRKKCLGFIF